MHLIAYCKPKLYMKIRLRVSLLAVLLLLLIASLSVGSAANKNWNAQSGGAD